MHLSTPLSLSVQVALKMIRKKDISSARMFKRLHREVNNMKKMDHSNVIKIFESKLLVKQIKERCKSYINYGKLLTVISCCSCTAFETKDHHVIAMEYLSGGELYDHVLDHEGLAEPAARNMFYQIVSAVQHCHLVSEWVGCR